MAAGLRAIGLGPWAEVEALPPLFVDLVEPVVAVSELAHPAAPSPRPSVAREAGSRAGAVGTPVEPRPSSPLPPLPSPAAAPPVTEALSGPPPVGRDGRPEDGMAARREPGASRPGWTIEPSPSRPGWPVVAPPTPPDPVPAPSVQAAPSAEPDSPPPALAAAVGPALAAPAPATDAEPTAAAGGGSEARGPAPPAPSDGASAVAGERDESPGQASAAGTPGPRPVDLAAVPDGRASAIPPEYDAYVRALRRRIQERLAYPWLAVRRGLQGAIELEVRIDAAGRLAGITPLGGDGPAILRDAATRAVEDAAPFPFPSGLPARALTIRLPVVFQLK